MHYIYGDKATRSISAITSAPLASGGRVEIQVDDTHAVLSDPDAKANWRINDTFDDVVKTPKIYDYANPDQQARHFHTIDYKTGLTQSLHPKRTLVQGEIQQVDWYADQALTDLVLKVEILYTRDAIGFALSRQTTRTWINKDDTENSDTKITSKDYTINVHEQLYEGQRRRNNLANGVSLIVLARMQVVLYGLYTPEEIVQKGRDFLLKHSVVWGEFIKASHQQLLTDIAAVDAEHDEWLLEDMDDANPGYTIKQYMIDEFTLY